MNEVKLTVPLKESDVRALKVGDRVIYAKYGGTEIKIEDQELVIMRESDILAKKV
jgi:co-chaperonin GroES (HSP10)